MSEKKIQNGFAKIQNSFAKIQNSFAFVPVLITVIEQAPPVFQVKILDGAFPTFEDAVRWCNDKNGSYTVPGIFYAPARLENTVDGSYIGLPLVGFNLRMN